MIFGISLSRYKVNLFDKFQIHNLKYRSFRTNIFGTFLNVQLRLNMSQKNMFDNKKIQFSNQLQ